MQLMKSNFFCILHSFDSSMCLHYLFPFNIGKTTILYKIKLGEIVSTYPTFGFNLETVTYRNVSMESWDMGGRIDNRALWRHYYHNTQGIIFVIDSSDRFRISEAREELFRMINEDELKNVPILLFSNKQDLPCAMTLDELQDKLNLTKLNGEREWFLQATCATSGDSLFEGLNWLSQVILKKSDAINPIVEMTNDIKMMKNNLLFALSATSWKTLLWKFIQF